jgi:CRP/FNR family transcriptional regulator, cyclic AMP receptor protein
MHWVTLLGYAASAAVLATFCMSTMIPLRVMGLISNVLFVAYGYADGLYPVLLLHAVLLPLNALRLAQFYRLVREMREMPHKGLAVRSLLPYMVRREFSVGETLVRKGDRADTLYYLVDGEIEVLEFSKVLHPGTTVGEIGVFVPNQKRTATIVCRTDCNMLELSESKAKQLYFQDRSFSFAVMQLIISRLQEDSERLMKAGGANFSDFDVVANRAAPLG